MREITVATGGKSFSLLPAVISVHVGFNARDDRRILLHLKSMRELYCFAVVLQVYLRMEEVHFERHAFPEVKGGENASPWKSAFEKIHGWFG